jgi:hypothetical protein
MGERSHPCCCHELVPVSVPALREVPQPQLQSTCGTDKFRLIPKNSTYRPFLSPSPCRVPYLPSCLVRFGRAATRIEDLMSLLERELQLERGLPRGLRRSPPRVEMWYLVNPVKLEKLRSEVTRESGLDQSVP